MPSELESTLLLLTVFAGVIVVFFLGAAIAIIWYVTKKAQSRRELLEELKLQHADGCEAIEVRYSTEARFPRIWKVFPWEGVGILVKSRHGIVFHGRSVLEAMDWQIEFEGTEFFQYIGRVLWPNGGLAWIMAKAKDGTVHYFSSETGAFVFGSKIGTLKALLELQ
jgi:hypothetical protein